MQAVGHLGLDCPIFATRPVWQMGHLCMYDVLMSRRANEDFDVFDADDNDNAFNDQRFHLLKYSQHADLTGRGVGIRVTPFQAGHMLVRTHSYVSPSPASQPAGAMPAPRSCDLYGLSASRRVARYGRYRRTRRRSYTPSTATSRRSGC